MEYISAKTLVVKNKSTSWFGTEYNMNIYKGCTHGCIYCDSRSRCYNIQDFSKVKIKENSLEIIRSELKRKSVTGVISTGSMSDPYNTLEEKTKLTREALKLIDYYKYGVAIATKSPLIVRDIDILKRIQSHSPVICKITITTFDDKLSKVVEPNVAPSSERFEALKKLADNGIYCGILLMPILPYINDTEENIIKIVRKANEVGVKFIYPAFGMTLRDNQRDYYFKSLDENFKGLKERYMKEYKNNYMCGSPKARQLYNIFKEECNKNNILYKMQEITNSYKKNNIINQMSLFD